jgi:hypothetical protein
MGFESSPVGDGVPAGTVVVLVGPIVLIGSVLLVDPVEVEGAGVVLDTSRLAGVARDGVGDSVHLTSSFPPGCADKRAQAELEAPNGAHSIAWP